MQAVELGSHGNTAVQAEATELARSILEDIENNRQPASAVALKVSRLARFKGDSDSDVRSQAAATFLLQTEENLAHARSSAEAARRGTNPFDWAWTHEQAATKCAKDIADWRAWMHTYANTVYYEIFVGSVASSMFDRVRASVDAAIAKRLPESAKRLAAAYENLRSDNSEHWAAAVHTCRRLLKDLADGLYPATGDPKYSDDRYINRLAAFITSRKGSDTFSRLVGTQIEFLGNRLDAIYDASNKGSHADVDREEADRYVLYTYLFIGDVLTLASG